ncbi:MAG: dTMP kinase [Pyramidobacter sp.]|jgi:dTMP kinase
MFITIEGIDGCGKSTQAAFIAELLREKGKKVLWTHEPGDWSQGDALRSILLNGDLKNPMTEILLFLADRCEHVAQTIEPALSAGTWVVCERYSDSTRAYQCWGRGLDRRKLENLLNWCALPEPDLTLWLDLPPEEALRRRSERGGGDRIESEQRDFHRRVARGFRDLAGEYGHRFVRIDAGGAKAQTQLEIQDALRERGIL